MSSSPGSAVIRPLHRPRGDLTGETTVSLPASNSTSLSVSDRGFAFAKRLSENRIGRLDNMPEKLRLGTPVGVLLRIFGESFRGALDEQSFRKPEKLALF